MITVSVGAPDGAATAARTNGIDGSSLIFVHGVGSTASIWDAQLRAFGGEHLCAAVELRGNGVPKPEPEPSLITREGYACDVLAVADALGMDRFTLVGCSLGGVLGFELWRRAPERIESLVIVGSFAAYPNARAYVDGILTALKEAGTMQAFAQLRAAKLGLSPERTRETMEQMACKDEHSYAAATEATWTGDYTAILDTIDVPTLVMCGERDAIAPFALSKIIADGVRDARLEVVPDAGHVANADAPDAFNKLLRAFLSA